MIIMNADFPLLERESVPTEGAWGLSRDGGDGLLVLESECCQVVLAQQK